MKAFHCDRFELPAQPRQRFPLAKYALLRERLERAADLNLELIESHAVTRGELALAHDAEYIERIIAGELSAEEQRVLGFPWSGQLIERARRSAGGTLAACRAACDDGVAVNLAGGTHHAKAGSAAGYCVFNDAAIAARVMCDRHAIGRVLIVDADVHQGDGTAEILRPFPHLYTFSIHAYGNFPRRKSSSDLDVAIADGMGDGGYLRQFRDGLERAFLAARPRLVIYLAGADPFEDDRLGRLNLSKAGLKARDQLVVDHCRRACVPLAVAMAGGYAPDVDDIVDIHFQTVKLAASLERVPQPILEYI